MLHEIKTEIEELKIKAGELKKHFELGKLLERQKELEAVSSKEGIWDDPKNAQKIFQELKATNDKITIIKTLDSKLDEIETLTDIAAKENDLSVEPEIKKDLEELKKKMGEMEISALLGGEHDPSNAILAINAGAGGTDAQDWAQILLRMYSRWAQSKGYEIEIADISYGEQAGIKSAVVFVKGLYAYGYLKAETGIHRLVRMSPFNSDGKRHTSFTAVEVIPETGQELNVEIKPEDLRIDTFRAGGPGGQNVNKTSSAIRITHLPTGLISQSQASPSQHRNKEIAMTLLFARLKDRLEQEQKEKIEELRGEQKQIAWGSQIRSYVFAPYQLVKDHRTGAETGNVQKVMDGDIDIFIEAFLKSKL
ncbi:MAG: peptide chain release factor 2 [Candidatus Saganbacteria bacterium]|nr:peptide chain release factor 2 [Candidatus Saganbacteria bacterium]